jgi:N-acetylmuramoyl-L-alanine amidase
MDIIKLGSPNFERRDFGVRPDMIIIHYTGTLTAEEAAKVYLNETPDENAGRISPHYMIDRDGTVTQFVDEEMRAWHAGKAFWRGEEDINSRSIGIELVNPGHENGYESFPDEQMDALILLCKKIMNRNDIKLEFILGHSDVSPGRKLDPGELFDWKRLADEGVGIWPVETDEEAQDVHKSLKAAGYNPDAAFEDVLRSFQQHYAQEVYGRSDDEAMTLVKRRLAGLLKQFD